MRVPRTGVRVLMASDGVWDAFEKMLRVCRMTRSWSIEVRACQLRLSGLHCPVEVDANDNPHVQDACRALQSIISSISGCPSCSCGVWPLLASARYQPMA